MMPTAMRSLAMAAVVMSAVAMEAIPQTSQETSERLLEKLLQPESASSLEGRRKSYRFERESQAGYNPEAARAANAAQMEAVRRQKALQWERATPAERLAIQQEDAAREAASARAAADANRDAAARAAATAAAREAAESAAAQAAAWKAVLVVVSVVVVMVIWRFSERRENLEPLAHWLGRNCRKLADFCRRVATK